MGEWTKLGLVVRPASMPNARTHAMLPSPRLVEGAVRVYFASCDEELRGRIYSVDLDATDPTKILWMGNEPVLDLGERDAFDADGVNPSQVIEREGALFLYYIGWRRRSAEVPYTLFAGLAVSEGAGETFRRITDTPILPPLPGECYFRTAPHVYRVEGGWAMLYIGGNAFFTSASGKRLPTYSLYRSFSKDGIVWESPPEVLREPDTSLGEIGFGRPYLWTDVYGEKSLLISVRTEMGYSLCELQWSRGAPVKGSFKEVLPRSNGGWDSEMVCFGAPFAVGGREYLLYNGNGFGRTGFGLAGRVQSLAEDASA